MTPQPDGALCVVCDRRPAEPGALLCRLDLDELAALLGELAAAYRDLDPEPGSAGGGAGRGAPGFGSRSPARDTVLVLTDRRTQAFDPARPEQPAGIVRVVGWWADRAREDGLLPPHCRVGERTVDGEVALLVSVLDAVAAAWWVADMRIAVDHAVRHLRAARGQLEPTIPLGACPFCAAGQVRARSWGQRARCQGCGTRWEGVHELRRLGELLGEAEMDAAGIARYCGVSVSTVGTWAHRHGWERRRVGGRTLYRLSDARAAATAKAVREAGLDVVTS